MGTYSYYHITGYLIIIPKTLYTGYISNCNSPANINAVGAIVPRYLFMCVCGCVCVCVHLFLVQDYPRGTFDWLWGYILCGERDSTLLVDCPDLSLEIPIIV